MLDVLSTGDRGWHGSGHLLESESASSSRPSYSAAYMAAITACPEGKGGQVVRSGHDEHLLIARRKFLSDSPMNLPGVSATASMSRCHRQRSRGA